MSVIVGISADSDFLLQNAGYRVLTEIAFSLTENQQDRRTLEVGGWTHTLDLTTLEREQARRLAWLLDEAAGIRIADWLAEGSPSSLSGAAYYETFQAQLRRSFGSAPSLSRETEPALQT